MTEVSPEVFVMGVEGKKSIMIYYRENQKIEEIQNPSGSLTIFSIKKLERSEEGKVLAIMRDTRAISVIDIEEKRVFKLFETI